MNRIPRNKFVRCLLLLSLLFSPAAFTLAQSDQPLRSVTYRLSMSRPVSHLFEVTMEVELPESQSPKSLDFQMAKWSPGRYAVFDFAKNVQQFEALGGICPRGSQCKMSTLPFSRVDDQTWRVSTINTHHLTVRYKVFGNDLSGTFSQLDSRHANYNGGSIFMYVVNHKPDPVKLEISTPAGWRIVNGRMAKMDQREWQFPNWGAETAMWGPPEFDSYTFLIHFAADDHSGDGMEHLTSTQIIESGALGEEGVYADTLDTVAHEFFHVWNVKRLRPVELGPWDFTRPANTRGLWIAEGLTNYYGHLMLRRSGIWDDTRFFRTENQTVTGIENAPGSHLMSAEESSLLAPFLDDAPHAQQTSLANTSISYYPKGELIGLVLDLLIRGKTNGKASLDDVMRRMYDEFYLKSPNASYYLRGRGYTSEDFQRVASDVSGSDLNDFFQRYVRGVEVLPYDEALAYVGMHLVREQARQPFNAGIGIDWGKTGTVTIGSVRNDSPAEEAGLQEGDEIVSLGRKNVSRENWLVSLARYKQGDRVPITVKRDRRTIQTAILLREPERFDYRIEDQKDATAKQKALRQAWLNVGVGQ